MRRHPPEAELEDLVERVAVVKGGASGEHDVSLVTGQAIEGALAVLGLEAWPLTLGRKGGASWPGGEGTVAESLLALEGAGVKAALIAMHGEYGEDGRIQAALELIGVPYQGSGVTASAVGLDKARSKMVYRFEKLPVAEDAVLFPADLAGTDWPALIARLGLPLVLKTAESGSSVGVEVIETAAELPARAAALLTDTESLLIESWLPGRELTVAVLEDLDGSIAALPVVEIVPHGDRWFDYETKYDPDAVDEICPAPIDDALAAECAELGLRAHALLGCRHYSRTDIILDAAGRPRLLETNTLPGLTPASLFPKAAAAIGMDFPALVARLVALAASRQP